MTYRSKRIRVRDVWIDWHPGHVLADSAVELPHNVRLLPAIPGLLQPNDTYINVPQEPLPVNPNEPNKRCEGSAAELVDNLLRGVPASQWVQTTANAGIVLPPRRFTNGSQNIVGFNLAQGQTGSNRIDRPLIYTLPASKPVGQINFHYNKAVAASALNWIPSILSTYPIQVGGITVRLFDSNNLHLGDAVHKPIPDVTLSPTDKFDTCLLGSRVVMRFNKKLPGVKFIHIHFHGRHVGLCEIEALPLPGIPPLPPVVSLVFIPQPNTPTAPTLPVTSMRTATISHVSPFTLDVEPGTKFFGNLFTNVNNGIVATNSGHSGSVPMASVWITLPITREINGFRFYKYDDPLDPNRRLDLKPDKISMYGPNKQLVAEFEAPIYAPSAFFTGEYVSAHLVKSDASLLATGVQYIKFSFPDDGFLRNFGEMDLF